MRVGYLIGPADLIAAIAAQAVNTYISPNMLAQAIVGEFCRSGAIERLDRERQARRCASAATRWPRRCERSSATRPSS